jgi:hypothetical protein
MPAPPSSDPAQFVQGAPVLHVGDVKATAAFYRDVLGFTWDFGDERYAVVWRDNSAFTWSNGSRMSTRIIEKSSAGAPRSRQPLQTSLMGFVNLASAISTAWASCSARTSIAASDRHRLIGASCV